MTDFLRKIKKGTLIAVQIIAGSEATKVTYEAIQEAEKLVGDVVTKGEEMLKPLLSASDKPIMDLFHPVMQDVSQEYKDSTCNSTESVQSSSTATEISSENMLAFSSSKMNELNSKAFKLYEEAEQTRTAEAYYKAGYSYDCTYTGLWGDLLFSGVSLEIISMTFYLPSECLGSLSREEWSKRLLNDARECFVISCECYLKALDLNPDHYYANIQLASALTAALSIKAPLPYWRKALQLRQQETCRALLADSMAKYNRNTATKLVLYGLDYNREEMLEAINNLKTDENFIAQSIVANKMLKASPYISIMLGDLLLPTKQYNFA